MSKGWTQSPKQNAKYLGSKKPFSEGEPGSLGIYHQTVPRRVYQWRYLAAYPNNSLQWEHCSAFGHGGAILPWVFSSKTEFLGSGLDTRHDRHEKQRTSKPTRAFLVGGFNQSEEYAPQKWIISINRDEHKQNVSKTTTQIFTMFYHNPRLVGSFNPSEKLLDISQIGSFPQKIGMKILKNILKPPPSWYTRSVFFRWFILLQVLGLPTLAGSLNSMKAKPQLKSENPSKIKPKMIHC